MSDTVFREPVSLLVVEQGHKRVSVNAIGCVGSIRSIDRVDKKKEMKYLIF